MLGSKSWLFLVVAVFCLSASTVSAIKVAGDEVKPDTVEADIGAATSEGSRTDDEVVKREEEAINIDGLSVAEMKELRDKAEKHEFQAEVNRMMKLIINSLYRNKEIFLRELISNASDALDKIRLISLTDKSVLETTDEMSIKIKADKENHLLSITDTGVGMTKQDLITNLGTIAKSGTADFLSKVQDAENAQAMSDLIGQFVWDFTLHFWLQTKLIVTTKHNDDKQYIWESDANSYTVVEDPRGDTLKRGTTVTLVLKEEAYDYLEQDTVKDLIKKYSQFINFNIYMWTSKTETVEEPDEEAEEEAAEKPETEDEPVKEEDEDAAVEEEKEDEEKKPKTKKVQKTTWDWELCNEAKPIWTRKPENIEQEEYDEFYKSITKDKNGPLTQSHFIAEGEVTFKSLLFIPNSQPSETFNKYGSITENIKL